MWRVWVAGIAAGAALLAGRFVLAARPGAYTRHTHEHRALAADIEREDGLAPTRPGSVVTVGSYTRPFLAHLLLAVAGDPGRLPERPLAPLAFDLLGLAVVAATWPLGLLSPAEVAVAALVFVSIPQGVRPDRHRSLRFDSTKLGVAVASAGLLAMVGWTLSAAPAALVLATVAGAVVVATDRRSTEAYVAGVVGIAAVGAPLALGSLLGSGALALVASGGTVARPVAAHAKLLFDDLFRDLTYPEGRARVERVSVDAAPRLDRLLDTGPVATLLNNPAVVAGALLLLWAPSARGEPVPTALVGWFVATVAAGLVASLVPVSVFRDPDSYLEVATLPALVVLAPAATDGGTLGIALVAATAVSGGLLVVAYRVGVDVRRPDCGDDWASLVSFLRSAPEGVVVVQPSDRALELSRATGQKAVDCSFNEPASGGEIRWLFPEAYLTVTDDLARLIYYFDPEWLVVDRERAADADRPAAATVHEAGRYAVYDVPAFDRRLRGDRTRPSTDPGTDGGSPSGGNTSVK